MPKGVPLTEEQKTKMREGREQARAAKAAAAVEPEQNVPPPPLIDDERRALLLEGIDPSIAHLITDEELLKAEAEEQALAAADRKKQALASVRTQMRQRARVDNDLISADVLRSDAEKKRLAEKVRFRVTVPNDGAGRGRGGFYVDGREFSSGMVYTESRAVFESLQWNHYRVWLSEAQFRTLDQHKPGQSAQEIIGNTIPRFEVV